MADTVTQDIAKFRPLCDGEDARFCDLVHLVRRCYNTLKEVGIPNDMDNSDMLLNKRCALMTVKCGLEILSAKQN